MYLMHLCTLIPSCLDTWVMWEAGVQVWASAGTRLLCWPKRETCDRGCSLESTGHPFYLRRAIERETGPRASNSETFFCLWGKGTFYTQGWIKSCSLSVFFSFSPFFLSVSVSVSVSTSSKSMNLCLMPQYVFKYDSILPWGEWLRWDF